MPGERVVGVGQQQVMDGGQQHVRDRLAGRRQGGQRQDRFVLGDRRGKRLVEWCDAVALALGKAPECGRDIVDRSIDCHGDWRSFTSLQSA